MLLAVASRSITRAGCRSLALPSTPLVETDEYRIPLKPTWSIHQLLCSYPPPSLSPPTINRLHQLSALSPPPEGAPEYAKLTHDLEDLIKLVEATKLFEGDDTQCTSIPDGRVLAQGSGVSLDGTPPKEGGAGGRDLLSHASHSEDDMYIVETHRAR